VQSVATALVARHAIVQPTKPVVPIREPCDRGIASWIVRRHGLAGL